MTVTPLDSLLPMLHGKGKTPPEHMPYGPGNVDTDNFDERVARELETLRVRDTARELREEERLAPLRVERQKRNGREYGKVEQPQAVITGVLAAQTNGLSGPYGAGKSLIARDWAMAIASGTPWNGHDVPERRNILWVGSEGMHDFNVRFEMHPLWEQGAAEWSYFLDEPVNLASPADEAWLIKEYADERPGLIVFDLIYDSGIDDDNTAAGVMPAMKAMSRVSEAFGGATLAVGHPGHATDRRFRGWSGWRQRFYTDWYADGSLLTCEKSKVGPAGGLSAYYTPVYDPRTGAVIRFGGELDQAPVLTRAQRQQRVIEKSFITDPTLNVSKRAELLATPELLGVKSARARLLITNYVKSKVATVATP